MSGIKKGRYLKPFRNTTLGCGCSVLRYREVQYDATRTKHQARGRRLPVICPTCRAQTWAPWRTMRAA